MTSDEAFSDEDGSFATPCAAFLLDNVSVNGGGEAFSTGFETREDGWAPDMTIPNEHFFVENRKPLGSDVNVWGGGGLAIWHVDDAVTRGSGNTGGSTNTRPRGLALEQADGLFNLEAATNRGDAGDPWPGSGSKTLFNGATTPNSNGYNATASTASVQLLTGNVDPIVATMTGGWAAPALASVLPTTGASGATLDVTISGSGLAKGCTAQLVLGGPAIPALSVYWAGKGSDRGEVRPDRCRRRLLRRGGVQSVPVVGRVAASFEVTGHPPVSAMEPAAVRAALTIESVQPRDDHRLHVAKRSRDAARTTSAARWCARCSTERRCGSHLVSGTVATTRVVRPVGCYLPPDRTRILRRSQR